MHDYRQAVISALSMLGGLDPELVGIVSLSLRVSLAASIIALFFGAPTGALLAVIDFRGRNILVILANALLGLPPVVAGLAVYLLLSRSGPLGSAGLLFTPTAVVGARAGGAAPGGGAGGRRPAALL